MDIAIANLKASADHATEYAVMHDERAADHEAQARRYRQKAEQDRAAAAEYRKAASILASGEAEEVNFAGEALAISDADATNLWAQTVSAKGTIP